MGVKGPFDKHFAAHDGVDRDIEQQSREHRGDGRRAFRVRIRQPVVQRGKPDLRPIADKQEYKRESQHRRFELAFYAVQMRPQERCHAFGTENFLGGEVQEDRAKKGLGDTDPAEDEVLPARLQARGRAIQRHEQHGGEGCRLH